MNKSLSPGILAILALILLYIGGSMGGAIGAALSIGGFASLVAAIVGGIKKLTRKRSGTDKLNIDVSDPGSIENTVKIQLHCYKGYRAKYPKETPTQIYIRVLADRPGYTKEDIKWVLNQAQSPTAHGKYGLRSVVTSMIIQEYTQENNDEYPPNNIADEIIDTVERLIPANI